MIALRTVTSNRSALNGLTRKSYAPARMASTATLIEPCAVITTTSVGSSRALISRRMSRPSMSGSLRSSSISAGGASDIAARASLPVPTEVTVRFSPSRYWPYSRASDGVSSTSKRFSAPIPCIFSQVPTAKRYTGAACPDNPCFAFQCDPAPLPVGGRAPPRRRKDSSLDNRKCRQLQFRRAFPVPALPSHNWRCVNDPLSPVRADCAHGYR